MAGKVSGAGYMGQPKGPGLSTTGGVQHAPLYGITSATSVQLASVQSKCPRVRATIDLDLNATERIYKGRSG